MALKNKTLLIISFFTLIAILYACRKISVEQKPGSRFSIDQSKDWFYSYFKKTNEWRGVNIKNSGGIGIESEQDSTFTQRFPLWNMGEYADLGEAEMIEFPYLANHIKVQVPVYDTVDAEMRKKIYKATLKKVVFIRNQANQIIPRVVHIVPDYDYALAKNFDISSNQIKNLDNDFSGWVMSYQWNGKGVTKTKIRNGRTIGMYKVRLPLNVSGRNSSTGLTVDTTGINEGCPGSGSEEFGVPTGGCEITHQGDQPSYQNGECEPEDDGGTSSECMDDSSDSGDDGGDGGNGGGGNDDPGDPGDWYGDEQCAAAGDPWCVCFMTGYCDDPPFPPAGGTGGGGTGSTPYTYNGYTFTSHDWSVINMVNSELTAADETYNNSNLCYGTERFGYIRFPGNIEHYLIQLDYIHRYPGGQREYSIPNASLNIPSERGYADIANTISKEIFEIKPDNDAGVFSGAAEAAIYVGKANVECGLGTWKLGTNYVGTAIPNPRDPSKVFITRLARDGVVVYKNSTINTYPLPVAIPVSVLDKIKQLIERLKNSAVAVEVEITSFLRRNEELLTYIKNAAIGVGVAIIVGTIVEDILTAGLGIADDWASFILAYRIIRLGVSL